MGTEERRTIAALDPGKHLSGLAVGHVSERATLTWAGAVRWHGGPGGASLQAATMAVAVFLQAERHAEVWPVVWSWERPLRYPTRRATHHGVQDLESVLEDLALEISRATFHERGPVYTPGQWKGQVPKPIHHARVRAELSAMEAGNIETPDDHNTWDAVALWLFTVGRLTRGGATPPPATRT